MAVQLICDKCSAVNAERVYLARPAVHPISEMRGTRIIRKGDLCKACQEATGLRLNNKSNPRAKVK